MAGPDDTVIPFRHQRGRTPRRRQWTRASDYGVAGRAWWKQVTQIMVVLPLTAFTAVLLWPSAAPAVPRAEATAPVAPASEAELRERLWPTSAGELDAAQPAIAADAGDEVAGPASDTVRVRRGGAADSVSAHFTICGGGARVTCVVDGDTFWYQGEKIRVADINTPEVSAPGCAAEARLGAQATGRLQQLLNAGPFTLEPVDRDRDRYGRLLRTVTRGGESLGQVLVREGLAEAWQGHRRSWC